jgi:DNA recombination protein RmuC
MVETMLLVAGAALGGGVAWVMARAHHRAAVGVERAAIAARLAAAETSTDEARKQLTDRELKVTELQATLDAERMARAQAETRLEAQRASLDEQRRTLERAREELTDTFKALSAQTLRESSDEFLTRARAIVEAQLAQGREAIDGTVRPLADTLNRYEDQLRQLEAARERAYGSLEEKVSALAARSQDLQRETTSLVTALRSSHVRGRWGELTLRRVVEIAGMTAYCDYVEQVSVDGGRLRPDMVVRLPADRHIVVDAKVPLDAYLDATAASTAHERAAALQQYAQQVRRHVGTLANKAYWAEVAGAADFVIMFMPGEAFFAAAAEADATLLEDALAKRVIVASPMSLVALLRTVEIGWRQEQLAAHAAEVSKLGQELYERMRSVTKHFADVGKSLGQATRSFDQAVGSLESRVLPAARRFRDLGAAAGDDIPLLAPLNREPRALSASDTDAEALR